MKFLLDNWMLILIAITSGTMLLLPTLQNAQAGLTPDAAVMLINREKATVIDVCSAEEFAEGHVGGSKNIPLDELDAKLPGAVKNKAQPLILVCKVGARSARAAGIAKKLGYENAQSIVGGLKEWQKQNLPLEKGA